jgi:outer membrane protein assembly factor BamA
MRAGQSTGPESQVFRIGGPYTYRGSDYGDLLGTKFLLQNLEYRFPLLPFLPPTMDFLSGFTFFDAAAAWGLDVPGLIKEDFQPFTNRNGFRLNDLQSAVGMGLRFNLGFFLLEYYGAWETDFRGFETPRFQFSIGSFF